MQVGKTGTTQIPNITEVSQEIGVIVFTGRLVNTDCVEVRYAWELFRLVAVTADNAAAVTENANDTAVFPVSFTVVVRQFKNAKEIFRCINWNLIVKTFWILSTFSSSLFNVRYETWPWT